MPHVLEKLASAIGLLSLKKIAGPCASIFIVPILQGLAIVIKKKNCRQTLSHGEATMGSNKGQGFMEHR